MTVRPPKFALAALLVLTLGLSACGGDDSPSTGGPEAEATAEALPKPTDLKDLSVKPVVAKSTGAAPTALVKRDVVRGKGRVAKSGEQISVQYVGTAFDTGAQFDASWDNGAPFDFVLGTGAVIPGWDQGVAGMRVGGRRILIVPPALAYGPDGSPPVIAPNATLVFVVDLLKVKAAP